MIKEGIWQLRYFSNFNRKGRFTFFLNGSSTEVEKDSSNENSTFFILGLLAYGFLSSHLFLSRVFLKNRFQFALVLIGSTSAKVSSGFKKY